MVCFFLHYGFTGPAESCLNRRASSEGKKWTKTRGLECGESPRSGVRARDSPRRWRITSRLIVTCTPLSLTRPHRIRRRILPPALIRRQIFLVLAQRSEPIEDPASTLNPFLFHLILFDDMQSTEDFHNARAGDSFSLWKSLFPGSFLHTIVNLYYIGAGTFDKCIQMWVA
ncbi:hypothetical protein ZIOFF_073903 [Zingiber officinale]|uniref:Uncharacterized protein n=1 Tax=Zingiber officinale TaxID=94328 RepID=A0A8J5EMS0_ZINOF|nr:hypothetical protein ZIOFF_073903 [Zingiber officinale]